VNRSVWAPDAAGGPPASRGARRRDAHAREQCADPRRFFPHECDRFARLVRNRQCPLGGPCTSPPREVRMSSTCRTRLPWIVGAQKPLERCTTIRTKVVDGIDGDEGMRHLYASWMFGGAIRGPEHVQHCAHRPASPDSPRRRRLGRIAPSLPTQGITNCELSRPTITCASPSMDSPTAPAGRVRQAPSFLSAGRVPQAPRPPFVAT